MNSADYSTWTVPQISDALRRDGYSNSVVERAGLVQIAARRGTLVWTKEGLYAKLGPASFSAVPVRS